MYLIAGLGNPEKKYDGTRHNAGFAAIDALADALHAPITEKKFKGLCASTAYKGEKLLLLKPLTYMNLSGEAVRAAADFYKIPPENVIVLVDDINLACGKLRVRAHGSAGGHNGLKNIIAQLGTDAFSRVRIGVGALLPEENLVSHVLGKFAPNDRAAMERAYEAAGDAALSIVQDGAAEAMNRFNGVDFAMMQ